MWIQLNRQQWLGELNRADTKSEWGELVLNVFWEGSPKQWVDLGFGDDSNRSGSLMLKSWARKYQAPIQWIQWVVLDAKQTQYCSCGGMGPF